MDELLEYLNGEISTDYWYDEALSICVEILDSFSDKEWNQIISRIPTENNIFCVRLAECLQEVAGEKALDCYSKLLQDKHDDVIITCIDSMRGRKDVKYHRSLIMDAIKKAQIVYPNASAIEKIVLDDFMKMYK